jgi:hypothetical protein
MKPTGWNVSGFALQITFFVFFPQNHHTMSIPEFYRDFPCALVVKWWYLPQLGYGCFLPRTSRIICDRLGNRMFKQKQHF